jgi:hypothetical protein
MILKGTWWMSNPSTSSAWPLLNPVPAGEALHDLWVRLTIDAGYVVETFARLLT